MTKYYYYGTKGVVFMWGTLLPPHNHKQKLASICELFYDTIFLTGLKIVLLINYNP